MKSLGSVSGAAKIKINKDYTVGSNFDKKIQI
jgi:hypothetical protein